MPRSWKFDPPGRLVPSGDSLLHLHVCGAGKPVVVLEAGIAATSLSWALVQPAVAARSTVVSYDRAGLGWSTAATSRRTPSVIARELHAALGNAGLDGPYVLAAHSFGGLVTRRFATLYPEDVSGIVLVDALSPAEWFPITAERQQVLDRGIRLAHRGAVLARLGVVGGSLRLLLAGNRLIPRLAAQVWSGGAGSGFTSRIAGEIQKLPRNLWPVIAWHWSQAKNFDGMARHLEDLPDSAAEIAGTAPQLRVPVTALLPAQGSTPLLPGEWRIIHVPDSGHWIQLDRPEVVIQAICAMVETARARSRHG